MKAGTAQKIVLNMLSTGAMVKLGKTYGNLMVDMKGCVCEKLRNRANRIVQTVAGTDENTARRLLEETNYCTKPAILMHKRGLALDEAEQRLKDCQQDLRKALAAL